jgi:tRNA (mo5U34)-methyltransferase
LQTSQASTNHSIYNANNYHALKIAIEKRWQKPHGDAKRWQKCLDDLPNNHPTIQLQTDNAITLSHCPSTNQNQLIIPSPEQLKQTLLGLSPWRKGPFQIFHTHIDSEWQSHWKWQRLQKHGINKLLENANILDIGCGNGYYGWHMLKAGASSIIGIDGSMLLHFQFSVCKQYQPHSPLMLFPLRFDLFPTAITGFDVVFSMGVLSHTKDPIQHLKDSRQRLTENGTLILETLIIDTQEKTALHPKDRYAKMNNVFSLPSPSMLINWIEQAGFKNAQIYDINRTSIEEQRPTEWMGNQSLEHFLDPQDSSKTIEGYPAPTRLLLTAKKAI